MSELLNLSTIANFYALMSPADAKFLALAIASATGGVKAIASS